MRTAAICRNVGKTIRNDPPVITIGIGGIYKPFPVMVFPTLVRYPIIIPWLYHDYPTNPLSPYY